VYRIRFVPSGREIEPSTGQNVLEAATAAGLFIDALCGGKGKCGKCRVRLVEGTLSPPTGEESSLLGRTAMQQGLRLACRAVPESDSVIFLPDEYILKEAGSEKTFGEAAVTVRPAVKAYRLKVFRGKQGRDVLWNEITLLLRNRFGLDDVGGNPRQLDLPSEEGWSRDITVLVWLDREIIQVVPTQDDRSLGVAADIGTTTVAIYLCDLETGEVITTGSFTNPQIVFGADVISRIHYSSKNPETGLKRMREDLVASMNAMIEELAVENGFVPSQVVDMTVVGNTVMHHIFLNVSPAGLGLAPFRPSVTGPVNMKAKDAGVLINPESYIHVLPVEAGFVGADNVAVIISQEPWKDEEPVLIADIGTNGEIVLGCRGKLFSCSCATGPALEGAGASSGMRAVKGAIDRIQIGPESYDVDYRMVGSEKWAREGSGDMTKPAGLCGSGIIEALAQLWSAGLIDTGGTYRDEIVTPRLRRAETGVLEFVIAWGSETATGRDIVLTQADIRQIQLAKAALRAGAEVLMRRCGVDSVSRIVITGAFGSHIDTESALSIGLLPPCSSQSITTVGNAAGHGAFLALVDTEKRKEAERIARSVTYVELASDADFQGLFMKALFIPYKP
jgi:uncharacterized 2Fe-2S/4Fe-4S cluster protein (DUF4445 family)